MRSGILTAVGVVLTIAGVIWALQGFGVIGGSFMSGNSVWAIIGPVVAVAVVVPPPVSGSRGGAASSRPRPRRPLPPPLTTCSAPPPSTVTRVLITFLHVRHL